MSDLVTNRQLIVFGKRIVATFVLVLGVLVIVPAHSAFADDTTPPLVSEETEAEAPVAPSILPPACTAVTAPALVSEEGEEAEVVAPSGWSALALRAPADLTNNPELTWTWTTPIPTTEGSTYSGYGYSLYSGDTVVAEGTLGSGVISYSHSASGDAGVYRLYVWIVDTTEAEPKPVGCENKAIDYSKVKPVISGDTWITNGNTARPELTADTGVAYSWLVSSVQGTLATISDDGAILNPLFTFLTDGRFTFTLIVTDRYGNTSDPFTLVISYVAPFIPGPEKPITPVDPLPIDQYVPPVVALAEIKRTSAVGNSYAATLGGEVASTKPKEDAAASVAGASDESAVDTKVLANPAQAVQPSSQGWVLLGVAWYWWLIGIALILGAWQIVRFGVFRRSPDDV